jgi:hypothetical protein
MIDQDLRRSVYLVLFFTLVPALGGNLGCLVGSLLFQ